MIMGRRICILLLCLLGFCSVSLAQQSSTAQKMPLCGQTCLLKAFATKACSPSDLPCICTNEIFQNNVTLCVTHSCTIPESLVMKNVSSTNCGVPVRDRRPPYIALSYAMIVLAGAFVAARFGFKFIEGMDFGLDDWAILAALVSGLACTIVIVAGSIKNGLGKDLWTLSPDEITKMLKFFYIMASLYFTELTLLKLSLLFFYIRVFPNKDAQRLLWGTAIFTILWGIVFVLVAIFQCQPINFFWKKWDGLHQGKCLNMNTITISNAGISIALDLWSLAIPLWQLRGLKMHWKKKVSVGLMFCVGTFITVVSILRIQALVHFATSSNVSYEFHDAAMWSTIEVGVGIMCTCLPTLRLLFVKLFPILGGTIGRSGQQYHGYGKSNELGNVSKSTKSRRKDLDTGSSFSPRSSVLDKTEGIRVETSYTVQRNQDADEASLVSHEVSAKEVPKPEKTFA